MGAAQRAYYARNKEKVRAATHAWQLANPVAAEAAGRKSARKKRGWAPGEHEKAEADRKVATTCRCCGGPPTPRGLTADHDHATGLFRGHVCHPCNIVLGFIETHRIDPLTFVTYLKR